ncbi:hypothetical protein HYDPIDRAFT_189188 [Hydnomerulius pinastri MD-312]|uniref:Uncharacterized protein n=1 Tax=Hydnomerulius pinastri MD-312 TaxID=994086 RepID=A0A0C9V8S7_9AGAM|nr:hypothetical protein HYDPIDRAFT_189188 [Hydnomerulius pinastri MD-312]
MTMLVSETCHFETDWATNALTGFLIYGLIVSYVPQHLRIIRAGTSVGFSPWFLLLGSTSSAAGMLNMITLQWPVIRCCREVSFGKCIEITAGVFQVGVQWLFFTIILVLYMMYYPPNLKYIQLEVDTHDSRPVQHIRTKLKSSEWRLSIIVSWAVAGHLALLIFTTFLLLLTTPPSPDPSVPHPRQITLWATFLGVSSGVLAAIQYAPQLMRTYRLKLVGALSIPMMIIQSPGGVVMAVSIAMRPGTDWTSWIMYAVSAVMQASLLLMCIIWRMRQRRLGIDDFGRPLGESAAVDQDASTEDSSQTQGEEGTVSVVVEGEDGDNAREDTPLLKPGNVVRRGGILGWIQGLRK